MVVKVLLQTLSAFVQSPESLCSLVFLYFVQSITIFIHGLLDTQTSPYQKQTRTYLNLVLLLKCWAQICDFFAYTKICIKLSQDLVSDNPKSKSNYYFSVVTHVLYITKISLSVLTLLHFKYISMNFQNKIFRMIAPWSYSKMEFLPSFF